MLIEMGGSLEWEARLPDGSGAAVVSFPLPKDHWLTVETAEYEAPPMPMCMGKDDPRRQDLEEQLRAAAHYAVRASTMNGKEPDFDPDAMVRNFITGMLGYWTSTGLSSDDWANPPHLRAPG